MSQWMNLIAVSLLIMTNLACSFSPSSGKTDLNSEGSGLTASSFSFPAGESLSSAKSSFTVPTTFEAKSVSWSSTSPFLMISGGTIKIDPPGENSTATLTATITSGTSSETKDFTVTLPEGTLYLAGRSVSGANQVAGFWDKNGNFTSLPMGNTSSTIGSSQIVNFSKYKDGSVYFAGATRHDSVDRAALWKDNSLSMMTGLNVSWTSSINNIAFNNNDVILSGQSRYSGTANTTKGVIWTEGTLTEMTSTQLPGGGANVMAEAIQTVFIGTDRYTFGRQYNMASPQVGYWLNTIANWNQLPNPAGGSDCRLVDAALKGNDLLALGYCTITATSTLVLWTNGQEQTIALGDDAWPFRLAVVGSDVYIGANRKNSGTTFREAGYYKNGVWNGPSSAPGEEETGRDLVVKGSNVYVTANRGESDFMTGNGTFKIGFYKNGVWNLVKQETLTNNLALESRTIVFSKAP